MATQATTAPLTIADRLLTEDQVAAILGWSKKTLQQRRWRGVPPTYVKLGASVRYLERDIASFINTGLRPADREGH